MDLITPTIKTLTFSESTMKSIFSWLKKSKGDSRALISELKDNLIYLKIVFENDVHLSDVVEKMSVSQFKRLSNEGFNFNKLKKNRINKSSVLQSANLEKWEGKETEQLIESIYNKINEIKILFPLVSNKGKYRWRVRVKNILSKISLLLRHVNS